MNIRAMYFSGTGTTAKVTAAIADQLAKALAAETPPGEEILREKAWSENDRTGLQEDNARVEKSGPESQERNFRSENIWAESPAENVGREMNQMEALKASSGVEPLVEKKSVKLPKCSKNEIPKVEVTQAPVAAPSRPLAAGVKAPGTQNEPWPNTIRDGLTEIKISQDEAAADLKHGSEKQATEKYQERLIAAEIADNGAAKEFRREAWGPETPEKNSQNEIFWTEAAQAPTAAPGRLLAAGTETWHRAADIDFTPPAVRQENYQFTPDDLVVFGVPVIAGRVPNVLLKFLDTLQGGNALVVPVVLYGNRNFDDALIELRNILQDHGFHAIAAAAFIGEHSFSRILGAGRPDSSDMELSRDFARKLAGKIRRHGAAALRKAAPVPVDGHDPIRPYYKPQDRNGNHINILKVKPKLQAELCSGCGICTTVCPMGSIIQENPGQAPAPITGICIKCCGCVKKCPNSALYFDDPGFLYHKEELEEMYAATRREPSLYL